ncbi:hypothetical protein L0B53_15505 [Vibrio sp. SS-MA-C1-2]|uniref:hypothetical protein n=1 Tax=Vibrio sp. SS-MA-C1-2 TaxID=2908646 RepID=UPI001F2B8999|nr:hypothetical protein [Vibrio sp. SS-MA-C1-2]UJF18412.1 hypothetical protein L0B53_15505 [Vibrio sp. SS-MA-C1-2]
MSFINSFTEGDIVYQYKVCALEKRSSTSWGKNENYYQRAFILGFVITKITITYFLVVDAEGNEHKFSSKNGRELTTIDKNKIQLITKQELLTKHVELYKSFSFYSAFKEVELYCEKLDQLADYPHHKDDPRSPLKAKELDDALTLHQIYQDFNLYIDSKLNAIEARV